MMILDDLLELQVDVNDDELVDEAGDLPVVEGGDEEEVVLVLGVGNVDLLSAAAPTLLHSKLLPGAEEPEQLLHPVNIIPVLVRDQAQVCRLD